MRVKLAHGAAIAATILGLTGCSSGPGGSGRTWYGAKTKPAAPAYSNAPAGPQLPSAAVNTPGAGATAGMTSVPPGAPASHSAASAEQPGGYTGANVAAQSGAGGYSPAAYGAQGGAATQSGPYNSVYNQGGAAPVTTAQATYPTTGYPTTGVPAAEPYAGAAAGATAYPGAPAGIHTADATAAPGYGTGANNMPAAAAPTTSQGYQYQDPGRVIDQPGATPYGGGAAAPAAGYSPTGQTYPSTGAAGQSYPATGAAGGYPAQGGAAPAQGGAYPATGYPTTGNTSGDTYPATNYSNSDAPYTPGNTGYNPGGAPPYQNTAPAVSTPASSERRDPNWRPGSTSDFSPTRTARGGSGVMSAGYETPIGGNSAPTTANPYATGGTGASYGAGSSPANSAASGAAYGTPAYGTPAYGTPAAGSVPPRGY